MVQTYGEKATRDVLGPTLVRLTERGLDIVCVDADLGYSTSAVKFGQKFPERFFPVGVAEQNMIGVAAGAGPRGGGGVFWRLSFLFPRPRFRSFRDGGPPPPKQGQALPEPSRRVPRARVG